MNVKLISWLPIAIGITLMSGLIYVCTQQALRMSANDPQIQMSEDIAKQLSFGGIASAFVPSQTVEISQSLSPYILIFDNMGNLIAGNGQLDGQQPVIPLGVFDYTRLHAQDRVTWQPKTGVRSAIVATWYTGSQSGFVVVGRSLREVERREDQLLIIVGATWGVAILGSLAVSVLTIEHARKKT